MSDSKERETPATPMVREAAATYAAVKKLEQSDNKLAARQAKNAAVIRLIDEWLADESGYDEETWPMVKAGIEDNRTSYRRRFSD